MDKKPPEMTARAKRSLDWLWRLDHRKLHGEKKSGIVLYRVPAEYKGKMCKKLGIVPIVDSKSVGTIHKSRTVKGRSGKSYRLWDLITMDDGVALKLAAAIHDMLGIPANVQPDRQDKQLEKKPAQHGKQTETDELEELLKQFRGA